MIPKNITLEHIYKAIARIDEKGIEWPLTQSKKYDLVYNDKTYPPKLVIMHANEFAGNEELSHRKFGAQEARNYLMKLNPDFVIIEKEGINPISQMITNYKNLIVKNGFTDELYKWELLEKYKGKPNLDAVDFYEEIKSIDFSNLMYYNAIGVLKEISKEKPEELRNCFKTLFDENILLDERMISFSTVAKALYKSIKANDKLSHFQDERSMACYLTYYNPEKYTFYKDSFYKKYCELSGSIVQKAGNKFIHYLQLIDELINEFIVDDEELLKIYKESIPENLFKDTNYKLLAQDILYRTLDQQQTDSNYWIFQGNPDKYDFEKASKEDLLDGWTVTAHKENINIGDKVIIWITGNKAGCYALAKVTSLPQKKEATEDDSLWKEEHKNGWIVGINITHNFFESPVYWSEIKDMEAFKEMKVGNQGTNFSATENEYKELLKLIAKEDPLPYNVWLISPGREAIYWNEFLTEGLMAIGMNEMGDLSLFKEKEEIRKKLQFLEKTDGSKMNDAAACWEFCHVVKQGDVVIAKRKSNEYIGWGIVNSDYIYDSKRPNYHNIRKVEWKNIGSWSGKSIVQKTLTNIAKYPEYVKELFLLLSINFNKTTTMYPLNQILYGPPGTGKTYNTINKALAIIENKNEKQLEGELRENLKKRFEEYINQGQIVFTTFHQSMSYEDFIEGIKPLRPEINDTFLKYEIKNGLFKTLCKIANDNPFKVKEGNTEIQGKKEESINPAVLDSLIKDYVLTLKVGDKLDSKEKKDYFTIEILKSDKIATKGKNASDNTNIDFNQIKAAFNRYKNIDPQEIDLTDIHKNIASWSPNLWAIYNGFYNFYKSNVNESTEKRNDQIKSIHEDELDDKNYVLIIDEINRGNVSQVFGELITLIEDDKRLGKDEALEVTLPYSKEKFGVPSNLYIIGTMNTADRSVEALDTALRRRFSFQEIIPNYDLKELEYEIAGYKSFEILRTINKRIEKLLDKDHQIGHSYFMLKKNEKPESKLINSFYRNIIPLLQEYFFGDHGKIGLVLGNGFISKKEWNKNSDNFADFDFDSISDFDEKEVFKIIDYRMINTSYKIKNIEMDFQKALKLLMKEKID